MTTQKRGYVLMLRGDPEISKALASGMESAQRAHEAPAERQLRPVHSEVVRQRSMRDMLRMDVGRGGVTQDDINAQIIDARLRYAQSANPPGMVRRVARRVLGVYGLMVLAATEYFNFDNRRWRGC